MPIATIRLTLKYKINSPTEMILLIHASEHASHHILQESLHISPQVDWHMFEEMKHKNRFLRFHVPVCDVLEISYHAQIEYQHTIQDYWHLKETPIQQVPDHILDYLLPSIYADADVLMPMAQRTFGYWDKGYGLVKAIEQWIFDNIYYESGSSDHLTKASDVLVQRAGVCRDFAHLAIAMCRALGIPARIVVGYIEIEKFSPDFHAIFEAYLDGQWVLFDATRLAPVEKLVRIATGVDASYVAFATFYGDVDLIAMHPLVEYQ